MRTNSRVVQSTSLDRENQRLHINLLTSYVINVKDMWNSMRDVHNIFAVISVKVTGAHPVKVTSTHSIKIALLDELRLPNIGNYRSLVSISVTIIGSPPGFIFDRRTDCCETRCAFLLHLESSFRVSF